ncbi:MAG: LuxR C-terminal-related transcriptional regulator [Beijerinckiaceae bacterium]
MASSNEAIAIFDRCVARLDATRSISELDRAFREAVCAYPFRGAAFAWWSHPPPAREPDFKMSAGNIDERAWLVDDASGDLWSDSRPQLSARVLEDGDDPLQVRVALLGPRRRFGVLQAFLSIGPEDIKSAEYDWKGRFLVLAHVVQHSISLLRPDERPNLGRREIQCLKLAAEGLKAKQIASALGIGQQTVQFHLSRAREKLNCSNTVQAVARAAQFGLLPDIAPADAAAESGADNPGAP